MFELAYPMARLIFNRVVTSKLRIHYFVFDSGGKNE